MKIDLVVVSGTSLCNLSKSSHYPSMDQTELIETIVRKLPAISEVKGLFLGGSFGRGRADKFSDVDLIALVDAHQHGYVALLWRTLLEDIVPIVFWAEHRGDNVLLNAITRDWLRCDLSIVSPDAFGGRSQETVKPLVDPAGYFHLLPQHLPPPQPNKARVVYLINEFIRVLGLLQVVVGRKEYLTAVTGVGILRDHLVSLMLEEANSPERGGALHLSRQLSAGQMKMLMELPFPKPEHDAVIDANVAVARQFFPRARAFAARLDIEWPEQFEAATRRHLQERLGIVFD